MRGGGYLFGPRPCNQHVARCALLQQQFGSLHHRLCMETSAHRAIVQHVRDRDQRHSLMVGEVSAHDGDGFAFGQACTCVIKSFVETIRAPSARLFQPGKVLHGRFWVNHRRKRSGVWSDDDIFAETALEPQSGHAKTRVLIGEINIARVVCRFRLAPGHLSLRTIFNLTAHHEFARLAQQARHRGAHHEIRHQVFKHRA